MKSSRDKASISRELCWKAYRHEQLEACMKGSSAYFKRLGLAKAQLCHWLQQALATYRELTMSCSKSIVTRFPESSPAIFVITDHRGELEIILVTYKTSYQIMQWVWEAPIMRLKASEISLESLWPSRTPCGFEKTFKLFPELGVQWKSTAAPFAFSLLEKSPTVSESYSCWRRDTV